MDSGHFLDTRAGSKPARLKGRSMGYSAFCEDRLPQHLTFMAYLYIMTIMYEMTLT